MCGFVVVVGRQAFTPPREMVEEMTARLVHRGPDDSGFHFDGAVAFGFRRLAILDLTPDGHQPMTSADEQSVIVYNGEIFNYVELRDELAALGHRFRSTGDTEVLLASWRQWGANCLLKLNGMFAFAIHDRRTGKVFGARDRFGIKPLYLHQHQKAFLLASEIKAILASGLYQHRPDWKSAARYLVAGRLDDERATFHEHIVPIEPGHAFEITPDGAMTQWRWWTWPTDVIEDPHAPEHFAELFEDSVRLRMRSDVPVGVCLSGGLDSTSVICSMARLRQQTPGAAREPLNAFAYNAAEFDESRFVRDTIAQTGAQLVPLETNEAQLWGNLERALQFQDEPVHSMAALVGFGLMGLARQHGTTVVLNGQGADEVLAGYSSYFRDWWYTLSVGGHVARAQREISDYARLHAVDPGKLRTDLLRHVLFAAVGRVPGYRPLATRMRRWRRRADQWFTPALTDAIGETPAGRAATLDQALRTSVERMPLPLYLRVEDRNSMAHSIEARLPFLDYRLVSYVMRLESSWKLRGPWNKYLLREAMRGRIPESVRTRVDKMGFPTPSKSWFANALHEPLMDVLGSRAARERGIYHTDRLLDQLRRHRGGEIDFAGPVFRAAQFEMWASMTADRMTPSAAAL